MRSRSSCVERRRPRARAVVVSLAVVLGACRPSVDPTAPDGPPHARLEVTVAEEDRDADLYVDGNYVGTITELMDPRNGWPALAPGVHRVEVRKAGRFPVQTTVEVPRRPTDPVRVDAELVPDPR